MTKSSAYYDEMYRTRHNKHLCGSRLSFHKDHFATRVMKEHCRQGHWLDVGCGCGEKDWHLAGANSIQITGIDFISFVLRRACSLPLQQDLQWACADIMELPFKDAAFDGCICSHVLEHIHLPYRLLAGMARVTKPRGYLVIIVPHLYYADDPSHCWHFTTEQLSTLLSPWGRTSLGLSPCGNQIAAIVHLGEINETKTA